MNLGKIKLKIEILDRAIRGGYYPKAESTLQEILSELPEEDGTMYRLYGDNWQEILSRLRSEFS